MGAAIYEPASVEIPGFIYNTISGRKSENIKVKKNQTVTLDGEKYGKVKIDEGATLIFTAPNIYLDEIKTKKNASIEFEGCSNVYIKKKLKLGNSAILNSKVFMLPM